MKAPILSIVSTGIVFVLWANMAHANSCCETTTQSTTLQLLAGLSPQQVADFVSPWLEPQNRKRLNPDLTIQDHDGNMITLGELKGRPLVMAFMYSRCTSIYKCPLVVSSFCTLQKGIQSRQLNGQVTLALISYDTEFDTPEVLKKLGKDRGFDFDDNNLMARPTDKTAFFDELGVSVNFYDNGVSVHQNELIIIDQSGGLARHYRRVMWDNSSVIEDISLLLDEAVRMKQLF